MKRKAFWLDRLDRLQRRDRTLAWPGKAMPVNCDRSQLLEEMHSSLVDSTRRE